MSDNELWDGILAALREQPTTNRRPDEYWVTAKFDARKRQSQLQIVQSGWIRTTDEGNEQSIPKSEIIQIAKSAKESPNHRFCIKDMKTEGGLYGSVVCAVLDKVPYFSYDSGQWLVYHDGSTPPQTVESS
jgi:hypothetical protein